jgi:murein DD-endopeptidase MepM/ murein hydrolase activator NlpD
VVAAAWTRWTVASSVAELRRHCADQRARALTATAMAACLVVTASAPEPASAAAGPAVAVGPAQGFQAPDGIRVRVDRDGFVVVARGGAGSPARAPADGDVVRPVDGSIPSAGNFGGRQVAGCRACSTNHQGTDFAAPRGTPVRVVMSGTVVSAQPFAGYGNQVLVRHDDGTLTRYGHLSVIGVRPGQHLTAGQPVGAVGSTGISTGPHLHFEVVLHGVPVDPEPWLRAHGID